MSTSVNPLSSCKAPSTAEPGKKFRRGREILAAGKQPRQGRPLSRMPSSRGDESLEGQVRGETGSLAFLPTRKGVTVPQPGCLAWGSIHISSLPPVETPQPPSLLAL